MNFDHALLPHHILKRWIAAGFNFLSPERCIGCGQYRQQDDDFLESFCSCCREELFPLPRNLCLRCGAPTGPHQETSQGCFFCKQETFAFESAICLNTYEGVLKDVCLRAKRGASSISIPVLWESLFQNHADQIQSWDIDTIVPVPLHWRSRVGSSNGAPDELARCAGRSLRVPVSRHLLAKSRWTEKQSSLSATKRKQNLKGAFRVLGKPNLSGVNILLVDDILTTGSTCHEVSSTLKRAGAAKVFVAVLSRSMG